MTDEQSDQAMATNRGNGSEAYDRDRGNGAERYDRMETVSGIAGDAREAAQSQLDEVKDRAAGSANQTADAARQAARTLRDGDQAWLANLVERGAEGLGDFANTLRGNDLNGLLRRAEELARSQPVLFAGGAVVLGFALTRVARAAATRPADGREYVS